MYLASTDILKNKSIDGIFHKLSSKIAIFRSYSMVWKRG